MAASDAIPVPRKNVAFRFYFAIRKPSDSTLITTWAGMDSEVSLDGAAYSDCTSEATEIGTTGTGYIDLTSSEMNADCVMLKVTVTNTGAVPLVFVLYPESAGDYRVADTQKVDVETIKTQALTAAAGITFPSSIASPTNITAATGVVLSAVTHTGAVIPTVSTLTGHTPQTGDSFARIGATGSGLTSLAPSSTALSTAQWTNTLATNLGTTNTTVATNLDATITSRMATYTQPTGFLAATFPSDPADQSLIIEATDAILTAVGTRLATASYTSPPSVGAIADAVWDEARSGHTTAGTFGFYLDAAITGISAGSGATAQQVWEYATRTLTGAVVLDPAVRVKLDGTQPDYAPATATALTTVGNNVTAILEDTGTTIPTQITALNNLSSAQVVSALGTGTWATALPWNAAWDAEVQSEVQDAIEVNNLDHLVKIAVDTNFATTVHLDSVIGHMADNGTTATFSRTTDSLEAIRDNQTAGSGASLSDIIAGVQSVSGAIVEAQNSATLSIRIGDTWTQDIESLGDLTDKTVSFALKKRASDADTAAIVFIVEGTGLTKLNGAATTAGWGSITILDEVAGDIRLRLESNATSLLTSGSYVDAVKVLENGDDRTLRNAGRTVVSAGVIADIT